MTSIVKLTTPVTDEYGGKYPNAVVVIRRRSMSYQETEESEDCVSDYTESLTVDCAAYEANYWYSEKTKLDGKRSRPLVQEEDDSFTTVFKVDLEHFESALILNEDISTSEKKNKLIIADIKRRFA